MTRLLKSRIWLIIAIIGAIIQASSMVLAAVSPSSFTIVATPSGTNNQLSLPIQISPDPSIVGKPASLFVAANLPNGSWLSNTPSGGWQPWTQGTAMPAYSTTGNLPSTNTITPINNMDVSSFVGATVYAGYGSNSAAMLSNATYLPVYTIAPVTGQALTQPPVFASNSGVLNTTLTAVYGSATIAGQTVAGTMTYDGAYPGPTLRVKPGDKVQLTVLNQLNLPSSTPPNNMGMAANLINTHYHGMHLSPLAPADYIYGATALNESYQNQFIVPSNHPGGLYWYHPHVHGNTDNQVYSGLAGLIVVEGGAETLPALQGVRDRVLALKNATLQNGALAPEGGGSTQVYTVNGQLAPTIDIQPGESQLWRVANISNDAYYQLSLDGHKFTVVAEDGALLWQSYTTDTLLMPSGKRFEFVVTGNSTPGTYAFRTQGYNGGQYSVWPATVLASVNVSGATQTPRVVPATLSSPPSFMTDKVASSRALTMSEGFANNMPYFEFNGQVYQPLSINTKVKLGTTEEWLIYNNSDLAIAQGGVAEDHTFHIHVNDFAVVNIDGKPVTPNGLQDTVNVKPGQKILIRMNFADFAGESVYHCHILFHEDNGMMANFQIVP